MSDISLTLVLHLKTSKIINDIAKVSIKSEKITPFGGIFHVRELFSRYVGPVIDKELIRNTDRKCMLVRGGESRLKKSPFTLEERIQKARDFLNAHHFMKVPDYVRLTGLSRTTAAEELRKLAHDSSTGITSQGNRSQKVYILRQ